MKPGAIGKIRFSPRAIEVQSIFSGYFSQSDALLEEGEFPGYLCGS